MKEIIFKKCNHCGAVICCYHDGKINCCNEEMQTLVPNSQEASAEKHLPTYQVEGGKIKVKVNHVMEDEHYIEWIMLVTDEKECRKKLKPGQDAIVHFCYEPGSILYAYCNKHGLWKTEVK